MAVFPGTTINTGVIGLPVYDNIIDNLITPRLANFREIKIYDEPSTLLPDGVTWKQTYGNWNSTFNFMYTKNEGEVVVPSYVDYVNGSYQIGPVEQGDNCRCSYCFDYFPAFFLKGFMDTVINIVNTAAVGSSAGYTIANMPSVWSGVIADLTIAMCMEKLIADYTMWSGRLIYAISGNQMEEGSSDVVAQFETLKQNAEERAYKSLDNEKFKHGNLLSMPTSIYYAAIRGAGGSGAHSYGKTRGWKPTRYM